MESSKMIRNSVVVCVCVCEDEKIDFQGQSNIDSLQVVFLRAACTQISLFN